jgi:hypothetical protein
LSSQRWSFFEPVSCGRLERPIQIGRSPPGCGFAAPRRLAIRKKCEAIAKSRLAVAVYGSNDRVLWLSEEDSFDAFDRWLARLLLWL